MFKSVLYEGPIFVVLLRLFSEWSGRNELTHRLRDGLQGYLWLPFGGGTDTSLRLGWVHFYLRRSCMYT